MGFSFHGLTSGALVARNGSNEKGNKTDVADVPAAVDDRTGSIDPAHHDKELGAPRSLDGDSTDEELNKIDRNAEHGVQQIQAMTQVWTRRDLLFAYIMYVPALGMHLSILELTS